MKVVLSTSKKTFLFASMIAFQNSSKCFLFCLNGIRLPSKWENLSGSSTKNNYPTNNCWSWRRLQHLFSVTIFLQNVLEDEKLLHWRHLQAMSWRHPEDMSWRCLEDMSWICLEDVLKTCFENVLKRLWRQAIYFLGVSVPIKSKCVSNKSVFHKSISDNSKANLKCINENPIISIFVLFWNSSSISILRIKISDDCLVLWDQLNSNSTFQRRWGNKNKCLSNIGHNSRLFSHIYI